MILITNREIKDSYKVTDIQNVEKLITMKKELNFINSNTVHVDMSVVENDRIILEKFFSKLGVNVELI